MLDITRPGVTTLLAATIAGEAEKASQAPSKHSWRVSPSSIGDECVAKLWYKFRWAKLGSFDGRMQRLFGRGHAEEEKLVAILKSIGWTVKDVDEAKVAEGKHMVQFGIKLFEGHLTGYLDGIGWHPVHTAGLAVLLEFKTYNTKRFAILKVKKCKVSDFKYYVQACIYMREYNLPWCLFVAVNKDDDELYFEIIPRDDATAEQHYRTAHTIVHSKARPARIAQSPTYFKCKNCTFVDICHNGAPVDINCRSCQHATAVAGGKFHCGKWDAIIPNQEAVEAACPEHTPIK